jgi:thiaminase
MKKRTRSILDELRNIGRIDNTEAFIETTGSNIIESAVNLLNTIKENYPPETAEELERRFINSIRNKEAKKFQVGVKKIIESKKLDDNS